MVNKTAKKGRAPRLAMCIPCHTEDLACIDKCFKSIKAQEEAPDIITMSVSSSTPEKEAVFNQKKDEYKLSIHYIFTAEPLLPGANRNKAAALAVKKGATHLSFFDFDDIMHPKRLKFIRRAFTKNKGLTGVVHGYQTGSRDDPNAGPPTGPVNSKLHLNQIISKIDVNQEGSHYNTILLDPKFKNKNANIHSGHASVKSSFWKLYPFKDDMKSGEDGSFNYMIFMKGVLGFIDSPLTRYLQ